MDLPEEGVERMFFIAIEVSRPPPPISPAPAKLRALTAPWVTPEDEPPGLTKDLSSLAAPIGLSKCGT